MSLLQHLTRTFVTWPLWCLTLRSLFCHNSSVTLGSSHSSLKVPGFSQAMLLLISTPHFNACLTLRLKFTRNAGPTITWSPSLILSRLRWMPFLSMAIAICESFFHNLCTLNFGYFCVFSVPTLWTTGGQDLVLFNFTSQYLTISVTEVATQ